MSTMTLSMPDDMRAFVEKRVPDEGFASVSDYLHHLVREAQKRQAKQVLEAKFREALESGPAMPMTSQDWVALRQEAIEGLAGVAIRP